MSEENNNSRWWLRNCYFLILRAERTPFFYFFLIGVCYHFFLSFLIGWNNLKKPDLQVLKTNFYFAEYPLLLLSLSRQKHNDWFGFKGLNTSLWWNEDFKMNPFHVTFIFMTWWWRHDKGENRERHTQMKRKQFYHQNYFSDVL